MNPAWAYSQRGEIFYGNWDDWGREIPESLPYAVVIATEMDHGNVGAGPHTPALFESAFNYGQGAFITTILSRWFAAMGYHAVAQHSRHYDLNMVPLAIVPGEACAPTHRQFRLQQTLEAATGEEVDRFSSVGQTLIYPIPSKKGGISGVRTLRRVVIWCG